MGMVRHHGTSKSTLGLVFQYTLNKEIGNLFTLPHKKLVNFGRALFLLYEPLETQMVHSGLLVILIDNLVKDFKILKNSAYKVTALQL